MNCCHAQDAQRISGRWWRGASGCVGSGALLVLLPKCPMCLAAYLAVWTGMSVAMPAATLMRPVVEILFVASVILLLAWMVRKKTECSKAA